MGRGRGKGKKQSGIDGIRDDTGSGEDEKVPMKRRGRQQKSTKDEGEEEEQMEKIEKKEEYLEKIGDATENGFGKKRKRPSQMKETLGEENGIGNKTSDIVGIKSVGHRPNRSRRKNKPRRAAEVGVECN